MPIFLHFIWDAATAWPDKQCLGARLGSEPRAAGSGVRTLRCGGLELAGSDPGPHRLARYAVAASHIKWRKTGTDVGPGPVFLSKKRRIGMDVSSGLIFLTHTQK